MNPNPGDAARMSETLVALVMAAKIAFDDNDFSVLTALVNDIETLHEARRVIVWLSGQFFKEVLTETKRSGKDIDEVLENWAMRCWVYRQNL